jgi:3-hydroxybutyrate dehydrogenase
MYQGADLTNPKEIIKMMADIKSKMGGLDILVNNAGIQYVAPIDTFPDAMYRKVIDVDLNASYYTMKYGLPMMKKNNWGRIINIASAHGLRASKGKLPYCSAKHGLNGMTKVVALETARLNITCNSICPGWVLTPLVRA